MESMPMESYDMPMDSGYDSGSSGYSMSQSSGTTTGGGY